MEENKSEIAKSEEKILDFWNKNRIFEKSVEKNSTKNEQVFYDGPPFATGLPHYGHIIAGTIKDVLPRYQTMRGKRIPRKWGWDCHGLPLENIVEKDLGLSNKKEIEEYGIENFNTKAKETVMCYADEWKKTVPRLGRWVDMESSYKTMDSSYTESVMWAFKNLYEKNLVYKGFKSMHLCPRCETTLSNFEVNQGYKDVTDISVTAKFEIVGEENTFLLAWTTTPWTLPGNVALAVNTEIDYVKIKIGESFYILAKERLSTVKEEYEKVSEIKGLDLVSKSYKSLFDYYKEADLENKQNIYKVYGADFVTTEDGTGIVHIAPAFGDDDYNLSKKENLPFIQHVTFDGKFKAEVKDFAGRLVKPRENPQETDIEVLKFLAQKDLIFSKEKIVHPYPHCWRCDTPLLNYATSSWFVKATDLKDKLLKTNSKINWVPKDIRDGRFGKWLEGIRDWSISRARFWGAPIPVWTSEDEKQVEVLGSLDEIKSKTKSTNSYTIMRHGQAMSNQDGFISTDPEYKDELVEGGIEQVKKQISKLKSKKIDLIIHSDFVRTTQTAKLVQEGLGIKDENVISDTRIRELGISKFFKQNWDEYMDSMSWDERFWSEEDGVEGWILVKRRVGEFIYDIDKKYKGKNILIIAHGLTLSMLNAVAEGKDNDFHVRKDGLFMDTGEIRDYDFAPIPHNGDYELDFHRPYIDEIEYELDGVKMKRIKDVFDCWFESGSMPFARYNYLGKKNKDFSPFWKKNFPAEFIAEGVDQTRGWFYSMLVLSVALFGKSAFKNVVVNGTVLAENGQKMSKRLKNYPDPLIVVNKYGADSLRYYLMSSPAVKGEDMCFSEKGVDEVMKKIVLRFKNVLSFYEMYKDQDLKDDKINVLDQWILNRLFEVRDQMTLALDNYELDRASRPLMDFVDDLSTWYIRRSRDRFKEGSKSAIKTTKTVLLGVSKLMAPLMPFLAEETYLTVGGKEESVHLSEWPRENKTDKEVLGKMKGVREVVSEALEVRAREGLKVRQPLGSLTVTLELEDGYKEILKDEVNVKDIRVGEKLDLDLEITPDLEEEGASRDLIRFVQDMRKKSGLKPDDKITLNIKTEAKDLLEKYKTDIQKIANVTDFKFEDVEGESLDSGQYNFVVSIEKNGS